MERLKITEFNKGLVKLDWEFTCSIEQVFKLGLLGYLDSISELRLRQYLILRGVKFLGVLVDYKLEDYGLTYCGQAKEVDLVVPEGVTELDWCFLRSYVEKLNLRGKDVVSLYSLVAECELLKEVLVDVDFFDACVGLNLCFSHTYCLQRVTFSKAANRARIGGMFMSSGIKEIRLREYVLNVVDNAWDCFCGCKELVDLDCSGVVFNKGIDCILGSNPKLETISFRDCWFGGEVELTRGAFLCPVTIDIRGARCKGLEGVKSLSAERKSDKVVDEFIKQFELEKVTLILD